MNTLAKKGKIGTIRIFSSVLLLSIYTIVTYNIAAKHIETHKLVQQLTRFGLTVLLMYFVFKGKKWAVAILSILYVVAALAGLLSLSKALPFASKLPLLVMIFIYTLAAYHLNYSKSFKAYFQYLQTKS